MYSLFLIFCWWNPILFMTKKIMEKDCEICCDNNVLRLLKKEDYKVYGEVIIKCCTFHKDFRNNKFVQYFVGANYDLKKRIYNISEYKPRSKSKFYWFALIIMCLSSIIQTPFVSAHTTSSKYKTDIDYTVSNSIEQHFKNHNGNFVLLNGKDQSYILYNETESRERYAPDSTFKLYLALFGFEQDVISQNNTEQKWDGKKYPFKEWNRNQDLKSSMSNSVNWYYENINRALSKDKVKDDLKKLKYGNQDISGKNSYWNESTLKISSIEQVQLLKKLDSNSLNYTEDSIRAVKNSLLIQQNDNYQLFGKTGTGIINHKEKSGWFIGFVKTKGNTYYFATHLNDSDNANGKTAKKISEDILKEMGLIN
ncbi:penicillin-binding transpeptidase domain-containing protein [Staphylococcus simulans]|uniref:penicillin-binding transpeptidase domain-containing protein n=1 Tax=Staphylococcus simulans TaxID=1286 RepID=UPI0021D2EBDD|nr:penicillin-binding transpeptidase domain-containing protein [Staphylococcus simulans]